jgi:hypothetical protein
MISFKTFLEQLLIESKQEILNLGYPAIIAKLFYKKYGKNAYLIAKWYRDYKSYGSKEHWFNLNHNDFSRMYSIDLIDMIELYNATDSKENYIKTLEKLNLSVDEEEEYYDDYYLQEQKKLLEEQIEDEMFSKSFFEYYSIVHDIISGKLKDLAPYKNLEFWDAQHKYDKKNIFQEIKPLKVYNNGFKWINVGKKCTLVGNLMKNCGSAGIMGYDEDRTIIALFDTENKPHVVVTYSPNEKKISGDQGIASTPVKNKYHRYVLDLVQFLGVTFDADKSKSNLLKIKYKLKNKAKNIRIIKKGLFDEYFSFNLANQVYYTNSFYVVSKQDLEKVKQALANKQINLEYKQKSLIATILNYRNIQNLKNAGINLIPINDFV